MTRTAAFFWTALVAAVSSIVVSLHVGRAAEMMLVEIAAGFIFLFAISWTVAGIVEFLNGFKTRRLTLAIVSSATSLILAISALVFLPA